MGFLKNFSEPFAFALALWPFVSMLLTVPVLALLYHRDNRIRLSSAIVAYGTVLYLLGLLCFTLYPMPADAAAYCAAHHLTPQINPPPYCKSRLISCSSCRWASSWAVSGVGRCRLPQYCRSPRRCFWRRCS